MSQVDYAVQVFQEEEEEEEESREGGLLPFSSVGRPTQ